MQSPTGALVSEREPNLASLPVLNEFNFSMKQSPAQNCLNDLIPSSTVSYGRVEYLSNTFSTRATVSFDLAVHLHGYVASGNLENDAKTAK